MSKRIIALFVLICMLFPFTGCKSAIVVPYTEGMNYTATEKGEALPVYSLYYEVMAEDGEDPKDVMPIGGFYAPFASGGSLDGHDLPDFITDKYYKLISDCGVNMFVYSIDRWAMGDDSVNVSLAKSLDLCEKYHIGYFVDAWWTREQLGNQTTDYPIDSMEMKTHPEKLRQLVNYISKNRTRKSFIGLLSFDEPFTPQFDNLGLFADTFYGLDNTAGCDLYLNSMGYWAGVENFFGHSSPMEFDAYIKAFFKEIKPRMLSVTQYPFTSANTPEANITSLLTDRLAVYRELAEENKVPFWRMMQVGGQHNDSGAWVDTVEPYPSEGETLFDVNMSLAYGAKAIQYFPLIEPLHYAHKTGGTFDFENRNGIIGADGNLTRWYYYAKRANEQIKAIDHVLMNSANCGVIVHGNNAERVIVTNGMEKSTVLKEEKFRQLKKIDGGDCVVGCFDYKGGTALYVVNFSRTDKADVTLSFDKSDYLYEVIQRGISGKFVGADIPLRLDAGEGALIVLS